MTRDEVEDIAAGQVLGYTEFLFPNKALVVTPAAQTVTFDTPSEYGSFGDPGVEWDVATQGMGPVARGLYVVGIWVEFFRTSGTTPTAHLRFATPSGKSGDVVPLGDDMGGALMQGSFVAADSVPWSTPYRLAIRSGDAASPGVTVRYHGLSVTRFAVPPEPYTY